jgi:uncharacterized protein YkwD
MGFSITRGMVAVRRRRAWTVTALAAALTATGLATTLTVLVPSIARAQVCSTANPAANAADPSTLNWSSDQAIQTNFTNARRAEGCPALTLPAGFAAMSPQEQMLSLFNIERTVRGLPALKLDSTLLSLIALNHNKEMVQYRYFDHSSPINLGLSSRITVNPALAFPKSTGTGEIIAAARNSAEAVYSWMYFDGVGSRNLACKVPTDSGCWGHRRTILGNFNWVGIGVTLNAVGSQWGNYETADFVTAPDYTPPATADITPPQMGPVTFSGGTATVTGIDTHPTNGTAGITQVVFYVNQVSSVGVSSFNTVVATQTAPETWSAPIAVTDGSVLHAVAVDGSGNYVDKQLALLPQGR